MIGNAEAELVAFESVEITGIVQVEGKLIDREEAETEGKHTKVIQRTIGGEVTEARMQLERIGQASAETEPDAAELHADEIQVLNLARGGFEVDVGRVGDRETDAESDIGLGKIAEVIFAGNSGLTVDLKVVIDRCAEVSGQGLITIVTALDVCSDEVVRGATGDYRSGGKRSGGGQEGDGQ